MYRFWSWLDDWWVVLFLLAFVLFIVGGATWLVGSENRVASERQDMCYSAGYDAVEFLDSLNRWGCLDVRDGQYVVVPIEDVRREQ